MPPGSLFLRLIAHRKVRPTRLAASLLAFLALNWWLLVAIGVTEHHPTPLLFVEQRQYTQPSFAPTSHESRVAPGTLQETFVIVALSGGGSRATLFGPSVLALLNDPRHFTLPDGSLLGDHISHVVGVSGGALAAASYGWHKGQSLEKRSYSPKSFFDDHTRRTAGDFEFPQVMFATLFWPQMATGTVSGTQGLAWTWDFLQVLPRAATLKELNRLEVTHSASLPRLLVAAHDLVAPARAVFTSDAVRVGRRVFRIEAGTLGDVVAASSAVPFVYEPYAIRLDTARDHLSLVDGGVTDNRALSAVGDLLHSELRRSEPDYSPSLSCEPKRKVLVIAVNASASLKLSEREEYGRFTGARRAAEVLYEAHEPYNEAVELWTKSPVGIRLGSCLGIVEIAMPDGTQDIPTRWSLSSTDRAKATVYAHTPERLSNIVRRIQQFLEWEIGAPELVWAHTRAERKARLIWEGGEWLRPTEGPGLVKQPPKELVDYVDSVADFIRHSVRLKSIIRHEINRMSYLVPVGRHTILTQEGWRLTLGVEAYRAGRVSIRCNNHVVGQWTLASGFVGHSRLVQVTGLLQEATKSHESLAR